LGSRFFGGDASLFFFKEFYVDGVGVVGAE
jgi:hypothetical protein